VRTNYGFHPGSERGEAGDGFCVGVEVGLGPIEPDGGRIVGIAGEKKAVGAVKETNRIGSVTCSRNDFQRAIAEFEFVAVVDILGDVPGFGAICFAIEALGKLAANLTRSEFILSIGCGTLGILAAEIRVHGIDGVELPVAADMVIVRVRIQHDDRESCEPRDQLADVTDAHTGVEEQGFLFAEDEVGDDFFGLVRFVDGEGIRRNFVNLEPRIGDLDAFEGFVFGARERFAPVRSLCVRASRD